MRYPYLLLFVLTACSDLETVGKSPDFTNQNYEQYKERVPVARSQQPVKSFGNSPSLWSASQDSLFGDRRAERPGDILTVVIDINDQAKISNSSGRNRKGADSLEVSSLFGIPEQYPDLNLGSAVDLTSSSAYTGSGSVSRNEQITLRVAATVIDTLQNDVLKIEGRQEIRINYELRELIVTGYIRTADISRQNEITYDKIAEARISYGGRGQISSVQQPRYGQQIADILLPF